MKAHTLRSRLTIWYAALLGAGFTLSALTIFFGMASYMEQAMRASLNDEARGIGDNFLARQDSRGEAFTLSEVNDYAPELKGRFVRIARPDGNVLFRSKDPRDGSFNPADVPAVVKPMNSAVEPLTAGSGWHRIVMQRLLYQAPEHTYIIEIGGSYWPIARVLHGLVLIFIIGMPVVIAVAVAGGYIIMRRGLAPINAITEQAERISSRTIAQRLPVPHTGDELESLSLSLNRMIMRLEAAFEHINRFSADVSHELRTPLAIVRGELEGIMRQRQLPREVAESIGSTLEEVERLTKIIDQLLVISRLDAGETLPQEQVDVGALALSTVDQMRLLAEEKSINIVERVDSGVCVTGDPLRLRQAVVNLLDNAIKYTPENGRIEVSVTPAGSVAQISISDSGIGISAECLPHIFERFYRTDKARNRNSGGAGLGLSIVKAICSAHGGEVKVQSAEGRGSHFELQIPLTSTLRPSEPAKIGERATDGEVAGKADYKFHAQQG
jgi:heavy metal sensor kinase